MAVAHPTPAGLLLAIAELAIEVLTLAGLASRAAAAGGLALSLTFYLTASWHTQPFFYGPDLPFAPAGWYWSWAATPAFQGWTGGWRDGSAPWPGPVAIDAGRRALLARGALAIGSLSDIPMGQAAAFTTRSGRPAVAVRLGQRRVVAYSAVCTHVGCTVGYDSGSRLLACPCHGAEFDPARGATPSPDRRALPCLASPCMWPPTAVLPAPFELRPGCLDALPSG